MQNTDRKTLLIIKNLKFKQNSGEDDKHTETLTADHSPTLQKAGQGSRLQGWLVAGFALVHLVSNAVDFFLPSFLMHLTSRDWVPCVPQVWEQG